MSPYYITWCVVLKMDSMQHIVECLWDVPRLTRICTEHLRLLLASPGFLRDVTGNYIASFMVAGGFLVLGTLTMATMPNYFSCTDPPPPQRCLPLSSNHKDLSLEMEEMNRATPQTSSWVLLESQEIWGKNPLQFQVAAVSWFNAADELWCQSEEIMWNVLTTPKELMSYLLCNVIRCFY